MANVSPRNAELYHLRLLLLNVPGATSFEYLRRVGDRIYGSYREAAFARGLVLDDREWSDCIREAAVYMMPQQLRALFAVILINCEVANPVTIWEEFRLLMTEDFR